MIVKDKSATIDRASELATTLMQIIGKHCLTATSEHDDDPAEHIYMLVCSISILTMKACFVLEEYGKIYGIDKFDAKSAHEWIKLNTEECIHFNKKSRHDE